MSGRTATTTPRIHGLAPIHAKFVIAYLGEANCSIPRAAEIIGVSDSRARGFFARPDVAEAIRRQQQRASERMDVTRERIINELAKLAFASMGDFVRIDDNGLPVLDLSAVSKDQLSAVEALQYTDDLIPGKKGEAGVLKRRVQFKLHNKRDALVDLLKQMGGLYERDGAGGEDGGHTITVIGGLPTEPDVADATIKVLPAPQEDDGSNG